MNIENASSDLRILNRISRILNGIPKGMVAGMHMHRIFEFSNGTEQKKINVQANRRFLLHKNAHSCRHSVIAN